jgi:hypothetical protein
MYTWVYTFNAVATGALLSERADVYRDGNVVLTALLTRSVLLYSVLCRVTKPILHGANAASRGIINPPIRQIQ